MPPRTGPSRSRYRSSGPDGAGRAQSEVLGLILLIAVTVVGITVILGFGSAALDTAQQNARVSNAEHAMTQFDSKTSLVALGSSDTQRVSLDVGGGTTEFYADDDAGWMNVSIMNESNGSLKMVVMNVSLGAVIYETTGETIAYQGGGVWKLTGDNASSMVSPPEFHYRVDGGRRPTLTLPLVVVDGNGSFDGSITIRKNGTTEAKYPVPGNADRSNPLESGEVNITIHSEYYEAWGAFFEDRTGGDVTYNHTREIVTITLVIPNDGDTRITNAIAGTATGEEMQLDGSGSWPAYVDSYNSSNGNYSQTQSYNGTIELEGDIKVSGNGEVQGNIRSGGAVTLSGTAEVNGTVYWTTSKSFSGSADYDGAEQIDGVDGPASSTDRVTDEIDDLANDNDNAKADAIHASNDTFVGSDTSGDTLQLNASAGGEYYIGSDAQLKGDTLILNTTAGDVTLAIDGDLSLSKDNGEGSNITVKGPNTAEIYVRGDITMNKNTTVHVPGDNASRMWFYATGESDISLEADALSRSRIVGVFYAPRGPNEDGDTTIKQTEVYGAIVAGQVSIDTGGEVHFDQALEDDEAFGDSGSNTPEVTFLHISINRITVDED